RLRGSSGFPLTQDRNATMNGAIWQALVLHGRNDRVQMVIWLKTLAEGSKIKRQSSTNACEPWGKLPPDTRNTQFVSPFQSYSTYITNLRQRASCPKKPSKWITLGGTFEDLQFARIKETTGMDPSETPIHDLVLSNNAGRYAIDDAHMAPISLAAPAWRC